jgi:hypothetical protein
MNNPRRKKKPKDIGVKLIFLNQMFSMVEMPYNLCECKPVDPQKTFVVFYHYSCKGSWTNHVVIAKLNGSPFFFQHYCE